MRADQAIDARKPSNRRGKPVTDKQREALKQGTKVAVAKRKAAKEKRKQEREAGIPPRWQQVEDGTITVAELSDLELARLTTANNDGTWDGRRHTFSSRVQNRMAGELARRIKRNINAIAPAAVDALEAMVDDDTSPHHFRATQFVIEHVVGKVPDVVHVGPETEWDRLQSQAFVVIDRNVESTPGPTVQGEVLDREDTA